MAKDRIRKNLPKSNPIGENPTAVPEFPVAILDVASKDFSFQVSSVQIAASGIILVVGWADDRSSKLRQLNIRGQAWAKTIDGQHIGRHRYTAAELNGPSTAPRLFGFWAISLHDRTLIAGDICSVEVVLTNGTSRLTEVPQPLQFEGLLQLALVAPAPCHTSPHAAPMTLLAAYGCRHRNHLGRRRSDQHLKWWTVERGR
jgi:hypothetical protein